MPYNIHFYSSLLLLFQYSYRPCAQTTVLICVLHLHEICESLCTQLLISSCRRNLLSSEWPLRGIELLMKYVNLAALYRSNRSSTTSRYQPHSLAIAWAAPTLCSACYSSNNVHSSKNNLRWLWKKILICSQRKVCILNCVGLACMYLFEDTSLAESSSQLSEMQVATQTRLQHEILQLNEQLQQQVLMCVYVELSLHTCISQGFK